MFDVPRELGTKENTDRIEKHANRIEINGVVVAQRLIIAFKGVNIPIRIVEGMIFHICNCFRLLRFAVEWEFGICCCSSSLTNRKTQKRKKKKKKNKKNSGQSHPWEMYQPPTCRLVANPSLCMYYPGDGKGKLPKSSMVFPALGTSSHLLENSPNIEG